MSGEQTALDRLAAAHGPKALLEAHREVRRFVAKKRREDGTKYGPLVQTYIEAMRLWEAQKADGVPFEERARGLEQTLRLAWPKGRVEPWHYRCDECSDIGWIFGTCSKLTPCGRPFTLPNQHGDDYTGRGTCAPGHSFARPCVCAKGDERSRALGSVNKPKKSSDFKQAGKVRDFSKVGR